MPFQCMFFLFLLANYTFLRFLSRCVSTPNVIRKNGVSGVHYTPSTMFFRLFIFKFDHLLKNFMFDIILFICYFKILRVIANSIYGGRGQSDVKHIDFSYNDYILFKSRIRITNHRIYQYSEIIMMKFSVKLNAITFRK